MSVTHPEKVLIQPSVDDGQEIQDGQNKVPFDSTSNNCGILLPGAAVMMTMSMDSFKGGTGLTQVG